MVTNIHNNKREKEQMKTNVQNILKMGGYTPIFTSIVKAIEDLHRLGDSKEEIKSCLIEYYSDGKK